MEIWNSFVTVTLISFGSSDVYVLGFLKARSPFSATIWSVLKSDFLKTKDYLFFFLESKFTISELKILQTPTAELL